MRLLAAFVPAAASSDAAPFGRRLAALGVDGAILALAIGLLIWTANAMSAAAMGDIFYPFWRDSPVVAVERTPAAREDERLPDGGGRRWIDIFRETRIHADGTIRVWAVAEGEIGWDDGTVEPVRSELLVGRNLRGLVRLVATQALIALLPFAYFAWFEASRRQASPGKMLFGLKVVGRDGGRIGAGRAVARQFLKIVEIVSTGLGYVLGALTGSGQSFHDILAGTRCVRA